MFAPRKLVIEPEPLPDIYGEISHMEVVPGGRVRCYICQDRGSRLLAVSRVVLTGLELCQIRPTIGLFLQVHGFNAERPIVIH